MRHATRKEWARFHSGDPAVYALTADFPRRLRNALIALQDNDPHNWMMWIEREIDCASMDLPAITRLVEARARALVLSHYRHLYGDCPTRLIFGDDWPFTDEGNLSAGA